MQLLPLNEFISLIDKQVMLPQQKWLLLLEYNKFLSQVPTSEILDKYFILSENMKKDLHYRNMWFLNYSTINKAVLNGANFEMNADLINDLFLTDIIE